MLNADSITNTATYMEMIVPLLHEAKPAGSYLLGQTHSQSSQVYCSGLCLCAAEKSSHMTGELTAAVAEQSPTAEAFAHGTGSLCEGRP